MSTPDEPRPALTQDELDELLAEVAAILNDGTLDTKEFWKAYIKRVRKGRRRVGDA